MPIHVTVLGLPQGSHKLDELRHDLRLYISLIDGLTISQEQIDVFFPSDLGAQTPPRVLLVTAHCRIKRLRAGQLEGISRTIAQVMAEYATAWLPHCRQFTVWPLSSGDSNHVMTVNINGT